MAGARCVIWAHGGSEVCHLTAKVAVESVPVVNVTYSTATAPGADGEDYLVAGPDWWVVLDGATPVPGAETGCVHSVRWLVRQLAAKLSHALTHQPDAPLPDIVAASIGAVRVAHGGTCDLSNPDSPSSTLAICRQRTHLVECLVLADSPIVISHRGGALTIVDDDRLGHLPGGRPYTAAQVRRWRNQPGGFWVASTAQKAARQAVTREFNGEDVSAIGMFTDGATRLVDHYGRTWADIFPDLITLGPRWLIKQTRHTERARPLPHGKQHDDATALLITWQ
jgi:hypothetical protein